MPIGSIPLRTWKSTTAASVNGPKRPSTGST